MNHNDLIFVIDCDSYFERVLTDNNAFFIEVENRNKFVQFDEKKKSNLLSLM